MATATIDPVSYEGYFTDVSAPLPEIPLQHQADPTSGIDDNATSTNLAEQPKAKRLACALCRRRKLRCDQIRPKCGTCARLGHECKYDEVRRKSGPKRGYVKALEARLKQVERLLHSADSDEAGQGSDGSLEAAFTAGGSAAAAGTTNAQNDAPRSTHKISVTSAPVGGNTAARSPGAMSQGGITGDSPAIVSTDNDLPDSLEMVALGLEEPLPEQELQNELHDIYFQTAAQLAPMINRARYLTALNLPPNLRPPICLRYAMWTQAASAVDRYAHLVPIFYQRSRKYLELDEMRGYGQSMLTLAHVQTWLLVSMHEFRNMLFPRAWLSGGRAIRLGQMMSLHRLDGVGLDVKQVLVAPRDETEMEERRRTFWFCFWSDRTASIGTGWPMMIDERDIMTNLPGSDDAFQNCTPTPTCSLEDGLKDVGSTVSPAAGAVIMASLFGRNLIHLHRPEEDDGEHDINGKFWQRHRALDKTILDLSLNLPDHLRLPSGLSDPNIVFLNLCLHTSVICLHQAAIYKAEKHQMAPSISAESKLRCIAAAAEISNIMRSVAHQSSTLINPSVAFCLYVAARVFVTFLRSRPNDQQILSSLHFIHSVIGVLTRKNPIAESFLAQLEFDMEIAGVPRPPQKSGASGPGNRGGAFDFSMGDDAMGEGVTSMPNESGYNKPFSPTMKRGANSKSIPIGSPRPVGQDVDPNNVPRNAAKMSANPNQTRIEAVEGAAMFNASRGIMQFSESEDRLRFKSMSPRNGPATSPDANGAGNDGSGRSESTQRGASKSPALPTSTGSSSISGTMHQTHSVSPGDPINVDAYGLGNQSSGQEQMNGRQTQHQQTEPQQTMQNMTQAFFGGQGFGTLDDTANFSTGFTPGPGSFDFDMVDQDGAVPLSDMTGIGQDWSLGNMPTPHANQTQNDGANNDNWGRGLGPMSPYVSPPTGKKHTQQNNQYWGMG